VREGSAEQWAEHVLRPVVENIDELEGPLAAVGLTVPEGLRERVLRESDALRPLLEARFRAGRAVEGHGDLRLEHCWRDDDAQVRIIDCVEFSRALRRLDPAAELAFLTMELRHAGQDALADFALGESLACSDDFAMLPLVRFFESYRAAVRAKVEALAADDPQLAHEDAARRIEAARRHLEFASADPAAARTPVLVAMAGPVASGKSSVARALSARLGGLVLSSDRLRKRIAPQAKPSGRWGADGYDAAARAKVYDGLFERAARALEAGYDVWLDASFSQRAMRDALAQLAGDLGVEAWLVEAGCEPEIARERLARRAAQGSDPSDAGPALLDASLATYEAPDEWPDAQRLRIDTGDADALARDLLRAATRIEARGGG